MEPVTFAEQNMEWSPRKGTGDLPGCRSLPAFRGNGMSISCWKARWKERLKVLFTGKVWLLVAGGDNQPPVLIQAEYPFFEEANKGD